jgi:hypothetical protein
MSRTRRLAAGGWLLAGLLAAGCRPGGAGTSAGAWLQDVAAPLGIRFTHVSGGTGDLLLPEMMGGGVAVFDYDGDGDLDLYLVNGNHKLPDAGRGGEVGDQLFRHEADGSFRDVSAEAGLADTGYGTGVAVGDVDNDGHPDVYVANLGPDQLYRNQGDGSFENVSERFGVDVPGFSSSATFCDYDRDGYLDLYVAQYVDFDPDHHCTSVAGQPEYCGPRSFRPVHDVLLHNDAGRGFRDVSVPAGIATSAAAGLGVVCEDLDRDGWLDFYVANDSYANDLWNNRRDGTFINRAVPLGAAFDPLGQPRGGMGVVAADLDADGRQDLFVTNLRDENNAFFRNLGPSGFADEAEAHGLGSPSLPYTGFGIAAFDLELDGDLDLAIANGRVKGYEPLPGARPPAPWNRLAEPNLLLLNDGQGHYQTAPESICGAFCAERDISRALAHADLDDDGDEDLVVTHIEGPAQIFRNDAPRQGHWLKVRPLGGAPGRLEPGTLVTATVGTRSLVRSVSPSAGYLTASLADLHFGLGQVERVDGLAVRWPDGTVERFPVDCIDCALVLRRGEGS